MRALFASLPALGHTLPLCSVAAELSARGHAIGWVAHRSLVDHLLPLDAAVFPVDGPGPELGRPRPDRQRVGVRQFYGRLVPGAADHARPVFAEAIDAFEPDVIVADEACLAGPRAARVAGLPWVSVHLVPTIHLDLFAGLPGVVPWIERQIGERWPVRSEHLTLIATSRAYLGQDAHLQATDHLVGALVEHRGGPVERDLGPRPRILATIGTLAGDVGPVSRQLAGLGTVLAAAPGEWLPVVSLMPHMDLVVCHAGQNTVSEALLHGVPLVLLPTQYDGPAVAARVEALGAGVVVHQLSDIPAAAERVLGDPSFAEAARRIGATLGPGSATAADLIEGLVR